MAFLHNYTDFIKYKANYLILIFTDVYDEGGI